MTSRENNLKELYMKVIKVAEELRRDEEKLIREIVDSSPNRIIYLGYTPVHIRGSDTVLK